MHAILIAGAVLAGVPVAIHLLLKQEPKRLLFPAVRFLKLKQRTSQRKLRLRHILLLALRVLVIALFCLALFQPVVPAFDAGFAGGFFQSGKPVAAAVVIDTTPSMGYTVEKRSRLDDAVKRAREFVEALPGESRVAVVTTADPAGTWELSPADAVRKLETLKRPDGGGQPVSAVLRGVYPLFAGVDVESGSLPGGEPLGKIVAVFTDRAAASFAPDQVADLKAAAAAVPNGAPAHLFFDVGADKPADVAVVGAEVSPVVSPAGSTVTISATVRAAGPDVPGAFVRCALGDVPTPQRKEIALPAGAPVAVQFTLTGLPVGVHQAEIALETPDNLGPEGAPGFDNVRYVTFRVGAARKLLTVSDNPDEARLWQLAHRVKNEFGVDAVTPADPKLADLAPYSLVCVLGVKDPRLPGPGGVSLWDRLKTYVDRGGRVLVAPAGIERVDTAAYQPAASAGLLPAGLGRVTDLTLAPAPPADKPDQPDVRAGVAIDFSDATVQHPLFAPVKGLKLANTTDFLLAPRRAVRFWAVPGAPADAVVARYGPGPYEESPAPAVLEKSFPGGGRVVLLTTRLDDPSDDAAQQWNDYWQTESAWGTYFPNLLAKYLAGDGTDANFQFTTGQPVTLPLPKAGLKAKPQLEGPGVTGDDAVAVGATDLRISPARTLTAGNYRLRSADKQFDEGFSLNPPADEADLNKVPAEGLEALGGPKCVVPAGKDFDIRELVRQSGGTLPLFPVLVVLLLLAFAAEGLLANRFYRGRG